MRVLIVDDHAVVRAGLRQILAESGESFEVGEAGDAFVAMDALRKEPWDLLLLDISLPGKNGLEFLKQVKADWKKMPVLILSMYPEDQYAVRALRAGASGYMTKETAPEALLSAVKKVMSGGRYISPALAEMLAFELDDGVGKAPHRCLSDREYEVMGLIGAGRTVSEIAEILSLSVKTISTYRSRILEKMKMKNNAELTHYVVKHSLID